MLKPISLVVLIGLAALGFAPLHLAAQVAQTSDAGASSMAPVPGPYRSARSERATPGPVLAAPMAAILPYWMRPQQPPAGRATTVQGEPRYITGWVWSPYAPQQRNRLQNRMAANPGNLRPAFWPGPMVPNYAPWPAPGFGIGPAPMRQNWPRRPERAPPRNGAPQIPNQ